jgi:BolA protein
MQRIEIIKQRLEATFSPTHLEVIDDSAKHIGHRGAEGGAGHYTVVISATAFSGLSRVIIHRKIYEALNDMIPHEIHALQIKILN